MRLLMIYLVFKESFLSQKKKSCFICGLPLISAGKEGNRNFYPLIFNKLHENRGLSQPVQSVCSI